MWLEDWNSIQIKTHGRQAEKLASLLLLEGKMTDGNAHAQ